jgi:hypothetical protein
MGQFDPVLTGMPCVARTSHTSTFPIPCYLHAILPHIPHDSACIRHGRAAMFVLQSPMVSLRTRLISRSSAPFSSLTTTPRGEASVTAGPPVLSRQSIPTCPSGLSGLFAQVQKIKSSSSAVVSWSGNSLDFQPSSPCAIRCAVVRLTPGMPAHFAARYAYPEQSSPFLRSDAPPQKYGGCAAIMNRSCALKLAAYSGARAYPSERPRESTNGKQQSHQDNRRAIGCMFHLFKPITRSDAIHVD